MFCRFFLSQKPPPLTLGQKISDFEPGFCFSTPKAIKNPTFHPFMPPLYTTNLR